MRILNVISLLLDYPTETIALAEKELRDVIDKSRLSTKVKSAMLEFLEQKLSLDLTAWQAEYDGLFERGRSLGLWLFEHVHGESRDRGQAMVDLIDEYKRAGLEIDQSELPDYIPLFLEFLSTQGYENAQSWLQEVDSILAILLCRLEKRESNYVVLFNALFEIANIKLSLKEIRADVANEARDDTNEAIDKEWEEEMVTFGAEGDDCPSSVNRPSQNQRQDDLIPVSWKGFNESSAKVSTTVNK